MDIVFTSGSWSRSPGWVQLHSSCLGSGGWDDNTRPRAAHAAFAALNAVVEGGEVLAASTPRIFPTLLAIHPEAHSFFLWLACVFSDRRRRTPCFLSFSCPFFSLLIPMPSLWCYRPFSHLFIIHYGFALELTNFGDASGHVSIGFYVRSFGLILWIESGFLVQNYKSQHD